MPKNSLVQVSGRGTNVDFIIDDQGPFEEASKALREYLVENRGLWAGGSITVNVGRRMASLDQLVEFRNIIKAESGLTVMRFSCDPATLDTASHDDASAMANGTPGVGPAGAAAPSPSARPAGPGPQHNALAPAAKPIAINPDHYTAVRPPESVATGPQQQVVAPPAEPLAAGPLHNGMFAPLRPHGKTPEPTILESPATPPSSLEESRRPKQPDYLQSKRDSALLVKSTCRSGEIIRYQGDVVVLGDVNPGAEVLAAGDIAVFGSLRGFAHAGAEGNTKATIVALDLDSPRIQIGPHVGVYQAAGQQPKSTAAGPVIAYVRRRSIHVALFAGRFAKYGRGELYDG